MRQKLSLKTSILLLALVLLAAGGSVAYFVTSETAHDTVSMSGVSILLNEFAGPEGSEPFHDLENIVAGAVYSKIPYVENNGPEPVWVRAKVTLKQIATGGTATTISDYSPLMELQELGGNWTLSSDGFYYYNSALQSGEQTEPIFKTVKFADNLSDDFKNSTYSLTVAAEATQVVHNGTNALDASWTEGGN